jgi:hypothetical protein
MPVAIRRRISTSRLPCCERLDETGGGLGRGGRGRRRRVEGREQRLRVGACDASSGGVAKQGAHGRSFVDEDAHVFLRLSQRQGTLQRRERTRDVTLHLVR